MKIQLDLKNKIIKIEENVNLDTFIKNVKKLLPNDWQQYTLQVATQIIWKNPIIYDDKTWENPYWYVDNNEGSTFNFEFK